MCYGLEGMDGDMEVWPLWALGVAASSLSSPVPLPALAQSLYEMHFNFKSPHLFDTYHS